MATDQMLEILGGEAKDKLFAQLFDIGRMRFRPEFNLEVLTPEGLRQIRVVINGLGAEDGSGNCWLIDGYITIPQITDLVPWLSGYKNKFKGFYNTRTRKGWMKPKYE